MLAGQPVKRGTMAHDHDMYMALTDAAAQQGDAAGIALYVPFLEELAKRDNHKLYLGIAQRARGIAARHAADFVQAETLFNGALQIFDELGTHWQYGRTLVEVGELERARYQFELARDYLVRALREFEAVGAQPDAARVRAALREMA